MPAIPKEWVVHHARSRDGTTLFFTIGEMELVYVTVF